MTWYGILLICSCLASSQAQYASAICTMKPNPSINTSHPLYQDIQGTVNLIQQYKGGPVSIHVSLTGFSTTDGFPTHGFHVHQFGDIAKGCEYAGPHFNPFNKQHGAPNATDRHAGDLGNLYEKQDGSIVTSMVDHVIKFEGVADITGRTLDVHKTFDDLGHSNDRRTGHSGKRLACCVIAVTTSGGMSQIPSGATTLAGSVVLTPFMLLLVVISSLSRK